MKRRPITFTVTQADLDKAITLQDKWGGTMIGNKPHEVALSRHRRKGSLEEYAIAGKQACIVDRTSGNIKGKYLACDEARLIGNYWLNDRHADIVELLPLKVTLTPIESAKPAKEESPKKRKPKAKIDDVRFMELWMATIEGGFSPSGGVAQVAHFMKMSEQSVVAHAAKLRKYGIPLPHHRRR